jgi:nucleoside-diphosphate-sugar epimerase
MSPPPVCLVTGSTGLLGRHVVRQLLARGSPEVFVAIRPKAGDTAAARFEELRRSLAGGERLRLVELPDGELDLPPPVRAVVHCAAVVDFTTESGVVEANVLSTWHLLCAAARQPHLDRFVHVGSLTIRTDSPAPLTEHDLDAGQSFVSPYTLTKFLAEMMIRKLHRPLPVTVVRAGTILPDAAELDHGASDWFRQTVKLWAQGRLSAVPMGPDQPVYPVLAGDLAEVIGRLLSVADPPPVLHLPSRAGEPAGRIFELLGAALDRAAPRLLPQHSEEWQECRRRMPVPVRRVMDGLYPPPPPGRRLAAVDSSWTERWGGGRAHASPPGRGALGSELAAHLASGARRREAVYAGEALS